MKATSTACGPRPGQGIPETLVLVLSLLSAAPLPAEPSQVPDADAPGTSYTEVLGKARLEMIRVPPGSFLMGWKSDSRAENFEPVHEVTLSGFWMGRTEVTQGLWVEIMGNNPASKTPYTLGWPTNKVNWDECREFCRRLSQRTGHQYTLPTEAQWEYACRAGTRTKHFFGEDDAEVEDYAWLIAGPPRIAGRRPPNPWGFSDMPGNVGEWCLDYAHSDYTGAPADGSAWLSPPSDRRVVRGYADGYTNPEYLHSGFRSFLPPATRSHQIGLRVVRTPSEKAAPTSDDRSSTNSESRKQ